MIYTENKYRNRLSIEPDLRQINKTELETRKLCFAKHARPS
jgi:hypothetical protein